MIFWECNVFVCYKNGHTTITCKTLLRISFVLSLFKVKNDCLPSFVTCRSILCRYKMGFCPNGPNCRYKHIKLPGPPPSVEEVLQKILQMRSFNRYGQNRNNNYNQQGERPQHPQGSGMPNQNSAENATAVAPPAGGQQAQMLNQQPPQQQQQQKPNTNDQAQGVSNGHQATRIATPLPQGPSRCVWSF